MNDLQRHNQNSRNYGIDLLRILSMIMVLILHVLGQGGVLKAAQPLSAQYEMAWLLETMAYCSVNCYALISGYVCVESKYKYTNLGMIWFQVFFYTFGIAAVYTCIFPASFNLYTVVYACMPVVSKRYWYVSAYFALFLLMPLLNKAMNQLNKKQMSALVVMIVLLYSVGEFFSDGDALGMIGGYSTLWLTALYIIGAYLKKNDFSMITPKIGILTYACCILITWLSKYAIEYGTLKATGAMQSGSFLLSYTSPFILLAAVALLLTFSKFQFGTKSKRLIHFFAPLSFAVYLIHVHWLIWENWMKGRFVYFADLPVPKMILAIIITVLVIYIVCAMIEKIRVMIFDKIKLRERLSQLEETYIGDLWGDK